MELEEGPMILDTGGHSYQVLEALGEGGQGEVRAYGFRPYT